MRNSTQPALAGNSNNGFLRVAIYVRVSTTDQAEEGYSVGVQTEKLQAYCTAHDWTIVNTYTDPGFSGSSMERPALQKMLKDINNGLIDIVLVYKLDRLSRSQRDTLYMIEDMFLKNNVDFVSMTENFNTSTPLGKLMIGIMSAFAQLERETITSRMQMGLDARAKEGFFHGGPYAPIGYDYKDGELVINDYEAMQIRKIYELTFTGMPIYSVYKYMRDHGYTHKYGQWRDSSVRSCLSSIVYAGQIQWKDEVYPGRHEAIIDTDTFNKMQDFLNNRNLGRFSKHPFQRTTLLGGIIFCGHCGARYYCKQNVSKRPGITPAQRYYTCYSRGKSAKSMIKDPNCKNKSWNVKALDAIVLDEIRKLAMAPEHIDVIIKENKPENNPENNRQIMLNRISEIEKQINKLIDLYQIGRIDFNIITEKIETLNKERDTLESALDEEKTFAPELSIQETKAILQTFSEVVDTADPETLRDLVHSLIDGIIIHEEDIEIHWKFA